MARELTLVDCGLGQTANVRRALQQIGANPRVTSDPDLVARARMLVLPAYGRLDEASDAVCKSPLADAIRVAVQRGDPLLAIGLGMHLLFEGEENGHVGLGILPGKSVALTRERSEAERERARGTSSSPKSAAKGKGGDGESPESKEPTDKGATSSAAAKTPPTGKSTLEQSKSSTTQSPQAQVSPANPSSTDAEPHTPEPRASGSNGHGPVPNRSANPGQVDAPMGSAKGSGPAIAQPTAEHPPVARPSAESSAPPAQTDVPQRVAVARPGMPNPSLPRPPGPSIRPPSTPSAATVSPSPSPSLAPSDSGPAQAAPEGLRQSPLARGPAAPRPPAGPITQQPGTLPTNPGFGGNRQPTGPVGQGNIGQAQPMSGAGPAQSGPPGQPQPGQPQPGQPQPGQPQAGQRPSYPQQPGVNVPPPGAHLPPGAQRPPGLPNQGLPPRPVQVGQVPPGQVPPGQVPPGQVPPGQVPPGQVPPGQVPPGQRPQNQRPGTPLHGAVPRQGAPQIQGPGGPMPGGGPIGHPARPLPGPNPAMGPGIPAANPHLRMPQPQQAGAPAPAAPYGAAPPPGSGNRTVSPGTPEAGRVSHPGQSAHQAHPVAPGHPGLPVPSHSQGPQPAGAGALPGARLGPAAGPSQRPPEGHSPGASPTPTAASEPGRATGPAIQKPKSDRPPTPMTSETTAAGRVVGQSASSGLVEPAVKVSTPPPTISRDLVDPRVPHRGWNDVQPSGEHYYFCHHAYVRVANPRDILWTSEYEGLVFPATIRHQNLFGCQFHPEQSQLIGLRFLRAFVLGSRS